MVIIEAYSMNFFVIALVLHSIRCF